MQAANESVFSCELSGEELFAKAFQRAGEDGFVLLESLKGSEKISRYSILAFAPILSVTEKDGKTRVFDGGGEIVTEEDGFRILEEIMWENETMSLKGAPPFVGGAIGFLSYDALRKFEKIPDENQDDFDLSDLSFKIYQTALVFDALEGSYKIVTTSDRNMDPAQAYGLAIERIDAFRNLIMTGSRRAPKERMVGEITANMTEREFMAMVSRAKDYILAGDIFQANLSIRLRAPFIGDGFELYQILKKINPSPFAAYLNFGDLSMVSSSPERLLLIDGGRIATRPIAGTRRRGVDFKEDDNLSLELILNEKERAEHIMLVDLERNDLGRLSVFGSVKVDELMILEKYSHVIHIVSNVEGDLLPNSSLSRIFSATFPGGTITGCPKIRSMEIIDELEPTKRGIYTGSIGYISFSGRMDFNIAIRTILLKGGFAFAQAGAGIVADSDPKREYLESLQKAEALISALREYGK